MKTFAPSVQIRGQGRPVPLDCQVAFVQIAQSCIQLIRKNRKPAMAAEPEAIHVMRIELTRLRAAILFFSPMVRDTDWQQLRKEIRWLNKALGEARDHDVTADYARQKRYARWARKSLPALARARQKRHRSLARKLGSKRYERLMKGLSGWIKRGTWLQSGRSVRPEHIQDYCGTRLRTWRKKIRQKGRHLATLRSAQLHRLRIQCKRYRYVVAALQATGICVPRQEIEFCKTAKQMHRSLGDLRDLDRLRDAVRSDPPGYLKRRCNLLRQAEQSLRRSL